VLENWLWDILEPTRMENSPKLNTDQLPKDAKVKKDGLLRGASAEEVAGAVRAWLAAERPANTGVMVTLARNDADIERVERRWRRIMRADGIQENDARDAARIIRTDRGVRFGGEIVLLPVTVRELESSSVFIRARGAGTLMHEWWHAARRERGPFRPFEEGTADAFAELMSERALGLRAPHGWRAYPKLLEGIELIGAALGRDNWYLPSREQVNVIAWLEQTFKEARFSPTSTSEVLIYTDSDDLWLVRVKRMIASKE
jgi:hypothetical protein